MDDLTPTAANAEPRTEADAEAGYLTVVMGGREYRLPVLPIEQSEEWQTTLSTTIAGLQVPDDEDIGDGGAAFVEALLKDGARGRRKALLAYDREGVLGGEDYVAKRMTQRELVDALGVVLDAEFPFETERHSVDEAFGMPLRVLALASAAAALAASESARSLNGLSETGASATTASGASGRPSSSSSDGPTASAD